MSTPIQPEQIVISPKPDGANSIRAVVSKDNAMTPQTPILNYQKNSHKKEWAIVRKIPLILVIANLTVCVPLAVLDVIVGRDINHDHMGAMVLIALIDFPSSLISTLSLDNFGRWLGAPRNTFAGCVEQSVMWLYVLAFGVIQYYLIGKLLRVIVRYIRDKIQRVFAIIK